MKNNNYTISGGFQTEIIVVEERGRKTGHTQEKDYEN
jgi:hypothetical protein